MLNYYFFFFINKFSVRIIKNKESFILFSFVLKIVLIKSNNYNLVKKLNYFKIKIGNEIKGFVKVF